MDLTTPQKTSIKSLRTNGLITKIGWQPLHCRLLHIRQWPRPLIRYSGDALSNTNTNSFHASMSIQKPPGVHPNTTSENLPNILFRRNKVETNTECTIKQTINQTDELHPTTIYQPNDKQNPPSTTHRQFKPAKSKLRDSLLLCCAISSPSPHKHQTESPNVPATQLSNVLLS